MGLWELQTDCCRPVRAKYCPTSESTRERASDNTEEGMHGLAEVNEDADAAADEGRSPKCSKEEEGKEEGRKEGREGKKEEGREERKEEREEGKEEGREEQETEEIDEIEETIPAESERREDNEWTKE